MTTTTRKTAVKAKQREAVKRPTVAKGRPLTRQDGLFKIIGIGRSRVPGGFSWRKHDVLKEAAGSK